MSYLGGLIRPRGRFAAAILILGVLVGASPSALWAQKNKKSKTNDEDTSNQSSQPMLPVSDSSQIEDDIGEMLAAFQLGNVDIMHKYYADNATWVRSTWDPPVMGWQNYLTIYNQERAGIQGMQIIRRNTYIFTHGDVAWATYQFQFDALMASGQTYSVRGQTSLVLTKSGDNWLIVHNHTSQSAPSPKPTQVMPQPTTPPPHP